MTELERLYRAEWGRLLAALIRAVGDFSMAEEALQDAFAVAVTEWAKEPPRNPRAWLFGTARHKAIDRLRQRARAGELVAALAPFDERHLHAADDLQTVGDDRLRLLFTCSHPALPLEAQVALTLRTLLGLSTEEIARAFLVPVKTMAMRLVRAKAKIREAGIPYAIPDADELPARLEAVMAALYLVFNEGYAATHGGSLVRRALCNEAIELTRLLRELLQRTFGAVPAEVDALLALMLLQDARREARETPDGALVLLEEQDRSRWDRAEIAEGTALVEGALRRAPPGSYALQAAIAAVHAESQRAADTDWPQIAGLYQRLLALHPSPVVALNHAVAVAMARGPAEGLALVDALSEPLGHYHLWHAARGELLRRLGQRDAAAAAYGQALARAGNAAERSLLARRLEGLRAPGGDDPPTR